MTNTELLALLREVAGFIKADDRCECEMCALRARIDAALAEHADSATPVVEWESGTDYEGKTFASAQVKDIVIEVNGWDRAGTRFYWRIFSTLDEEGGANTLDEAKSAAIAAARGMR